MFESMPDAGVRSAGRRILALIFSALAHVVLVLALVILPLVYFNVLPHLDILTILVAAPAPPPTPAPPAPPPSEDHSARATAQDTPATTFTVPDKLPQGLPAPNEEPPVVGLTPGLDKIGTGIQSLAGAVEHGLRANILDAAPLAPPPPPPPAPKAARVKRGGEVQESKLVRRIVPEYPPIAVRAHVEGTVLLEIDVDEEGNVTDVRVLQGNPLLVPEAVRAVKQWKYSPTLLNGEPIPILSTVKVEFHLKR